MVCFHIPAPVPGGGKAALPRRAFVWLALGVAPLLALAISLAVGSTRISLPQIFETITGSGDETTRLILLQIRLPRAMLAGLAGAGLAAAGAAYQGLFRNPLADPFVTGSASGAALGAATVIVMAWPIASLGQTAVPMGAFIGALLAALLVAFAANAAGGHSMVGLLLAGAAVASMLNAAVWVLLTFDDRPLHQVISWLLGSYNGRGWPDLIATAPWILLAIVLLSLLSRPLDALGQGEDAARALGLPLRTVAIVVLLVGSLATAAAVAAGGVVGFIGLVAPYLARRLVGNRHLALTPASALLGATLLILADTGSRITVPELPVGVLTALLGGPFFLWILRGKS